MTTNSAASIRSAESMTMTLDGLTVALRTCGRSWRSGKLARLAALSAVLISSGPNHTWFHDGKSASSTDLTKADLPQPDSPNTTVTEFSATAVRKDAFSAVRGMT